MVSYHCFINENLVGKLIILGNKLLLPLGTEERERKISRHCGWSGYVKNEQGTIGNLFS